MNPLVLFKTYWSYSAVVVAVKLKLFGKGEEDGCCVVAKLRQPTILLTPSGGKVGAGLAAEVGKAVKSANANTPLRPTSVTYVLGVEDGLG